MSEFPSVEAQELVTKEFLRAELAELRLELGGLRTELRGEMSSLETRLTVRMGWPLPPARLCWPRSVF